MTQTLLEAVSWRLASELHRRHPDIDLWELHPGGGQYDVLGLRSRQGLQIDLNRTGRIHIHQRHDGLPVQTEPLAWDEYVTAEDPRTFIRELESVAGLPVADVLSPSTPPVLVFRSIAALTAGALLAEPLYVSMGFADSSAGSGPAPWLDGLSDTDPGLVLPRPDDPFGEPGYRFWRVERSDLLLTFEVSQGRVWSPSGDELELGEEYRLAGRSLGAVVGRLWHFGRRQASREG